MNRDISVAISDRLCVTGTYIEPEETKGEDFELDRIYYDDTDITDAVDELSDMVNGCTIYEVLREKVLDKIS